MVACSDPRASKLQAKFEEPYQVFSDRDNGVQRINKANHVEKIDMGHVKPFVSSAIGVAVVLS
ncbi:hypothetical protein JG687_00014319 [Phytophthora cactorum]|uniref:Uncharacterized protein n=1 Tax=Phytophthora cactorum TaxID=29920 RepID=A0A8T1TY14_9STRA|nr:hypothetical protein PC120_g21252 [Phytophthora cactorum]KAG4042758.1 hypothetical protein PC123_g21758 [Phytophthora cactorum]KAG6950332.1 hypothetical protein JG687_00014319 [Phytophthora cactorum]